MDNSEDKNKEASNVDNPQNEENEKLTRYKEQVAGSKKEADRLRNLAIESEVKLAEVDSSSIIELHKKDPSLANEVAIKFWYSNFEEVKSSLEDESGVYDNLNSAVGTTKEDFEKWYKEKKATEESNNANSEADKILNTLEWDTQTEAKKYYKMMTEGRNLTVSQATEMAKMATLYVNKDKLKSERYDEWLINLWSTGLWKSKAVKPADNKSKDFWKNAFWGKFAHLYK